MDPSDAELLGSWRSGDMRAGEALLERYYDVVERFFLNKVAESIGDLVQETFKACVESRDRINEQGKFRPFLFGIANNVLLKHLRARYRMPQNIDLDELSIHALSPGPGTLAVRHREQRLLLEGLRRIPFKHQVILELHYWEGLTTMEIAEVLDMPTGTVRRRLQDARICLEQVMGQLAGSPELLDSTLVRLEDWAHQCRLAMDPAPPRIHDSYQDVKRTQKKNRKKYDPNTP
jgi:RNA polymerase sigma-70 factor, ECF subfamily